MNKISRTLVVALSICIFISSTTLSNAASQTSKGQTSKVQQSSDVETEIRNVILLIPDGMSTAGTTLARWYNGGMPLALDEMASGLVKTYWAAGPITDSAPAATAFATGYKSTVNYVSVAPEAIEMPFYTPKNEVEAKKPLATVLEGAKLAGKSTGLIATSEISHATPASFASHTSARSEEENIAEQILYNNVDVVLGGTTYYMTAENRKDGEDLISVAKANGYDFVTTPEQMKNSKSNKIWGTFADMDLAYDFDRTSSVEPSLEQMTNKAITVLNQNKKGFFLMVEGSKIDWAAHANDPVGVISDILSFDKAVKTALDFAKKDGHTLVIACTDHGNGGISIGSSTTNSDYSKLGLESFIAPLKKAKLTAEGVAIKIFESDKTNVKEIVSQYYGISDLTEDELKQIDAALAKDAEKKITNGKSSGVGVVLAKAMSKRANIGWDTTGHTGEDVTLYTYGPNGQKLTGVVENTQIADYISKYLGINLNDVNKKLYLNTDQAFKANGASVTVDASDSNNPVLIVKKGENTYTFPVNKNIVYANNEKKTLPGITVLTDRFYVPAAAAELVK